jgi:hypothetical protein
MELYGGLRIACQAFDCPNNHVVVVKRQLLLLLQDIRLDIELDIVPVVFFEVNDGTKSNPDETFWMVPETD